MRRVILMNTTDNYVALVSKNKNRLIQLIKYTVVPVAVVLLLLSAAEGKGSPASIVIFLFRAFLILLKSRLVTYGILLLYLFYYVFDKINRCVATFTNCARNAGHLKYF